MIRTRQKTGSSVAMRESANGDGGGQIEITRFGSVARVLAGEEGRATFDHWSALPIGTRHLYAEGVLHGGEIAVRAAVVDQVYLRDVGTDDTVQELCIQIGPFLKVVQLTPKRLAGWAHVIAGCLSRHLRRGATDKAA